MKTVNLTAEVVVHSPLQNWHAQAKLFVCEKWAIPAVRPAMISIVPTSQSGPAFAASVQLAGSLSRVLSKIAASPKPAYCPGPGPYGCDVHKQTAARCVLALVGDGSPLVDYSQAVAMWSAIVAKDPRYKVVLTCPASALGQFLAQVKPWFPDVKIFPWTGQPAEAVPALLNGADLTAQDYRVFISYFQRDGRQHADDLQAALGLRGFDVFLDRAAINVGESIPQRIREEIAHKSILMVLETPRVNESLWVPQEIAIASANRLGLLAIHFPQGGRVASLSNRRRETLSGMHIDGNGRLTSDALDLIGQRVAKLHDFWLLRRRYQLQRALSHALLHRGISNHRLTPEGWLDVVPKWKSRTVCSIRTTPRLADLADFRDLDAALAPASVWQRAVLAPGTLVAGRRQAEMRWLSELTRVGLFDESDMRHVADLVSDPLGTVLQ